MKDGQRRLSTTDTSQSGDSSLFVLVRALSCLFAFVPPESSYKMFACESYRKLLAYCSAMCIAADRPPELEVVLAEAFSRRLREGVIQLTEGSRS